MKKQPSLFTHLCWHNRPLRWSLLGILLPICGVMTAYAVTEPLPVALSPETEIVIEELPPIFVDHGSFQGSYWTEETVKKGDTLSQVLKRLGMSEAHINSVLAKSPIDTKLKQLNEGQTISIRLDSNGNITDIQFFNDDDNGERNLIAIEKINGKWQASASELSMETMPSLRSVVVRTSARGAMAQANIPVEIRESLSEIFADRFSLESLKPGDTIRLFYNSLYFRGQEMATGDILAAEITKNGTTHVAYYFNPGNDESGSYYDAKGQSLQKKEGFNILPVTYTRISSPYGVRFHPVLHTVKMHTGIDYSAPTGTPIKATADGVISFKGWKGGYGNTVMLQHSNGVETLYAHMSAFSTAQGRVRAGDVIGYVGSTGRSTGPHLHYEARIHGQPVNPTTVALPTPKLNSTELAAFRKQKALAAEKLAVIKNVPVTVAQLD